MLLLYLMSPFTETVQTGDCTRTLVHGGLTFMSWPPALREEPISGSISTQQYQHHQYHHHYQHTEILVSTVHSSTLHEQDWKKDDLIKNDGQ